MKKSFFTIITVIIAILFWLFDTSVHYFLYKESVFELIPSDVNELWMRTVICLLIISLGILADRFTKRLVKKERQHEAIQIHKATVASSQHILNNFLQTMILLRDEAKRSQDFNQELVEYFDRSIKEASDLLNRLTNIEKINCENIDAVVHPDNQKRSA